MMRDDAEIVAGEHQREQRADAGRRQRRQDRDRVDVALVEHAQHDVHVTIAARISSSSLPSDAWKAERRALELV